MNQLRIGTTSRRAPGWSLMRRVRPILLLGTFAALAACGNERQDIFTPEGDKAES